MTMAEIPLHGRYAAGRCAFVDQADYDRLAGYRWLVSAHGYAIRYVGKTRERKMIMMHREITACPPRRLVDHINHDTLDNRRENLRTCTTSENNHNRLKIPSGAVWCRSNGGWIARMTINGKTRCLGTYPTRAEAEAARKGADLALFGRMSCFRSRYHPPRKVS